MMLSELRKRQVHRRGADRALARAGALRGAGPPVCPFALIPEFVLPRQRIAGLYKQVDTMWS